jgi:SAM-dependent methyltransferase
MRYKNECPVCESTHTATFLNLNNVPIHQNLLFEDQVSAQKIARGNLNLMICNECGFIFNKDFDFSKLRYGEDYDNTQIYSSSFNEYVNDLVNYLISEKDVRKYRILEVGCGKGLFLRKLVEDGGEANVGYGFDPSYDGPENVLNGRLKFEKRYYGPQYTDVSVDIAVCRHVIEHVAEPLDLLRNIKQSLVNSPQGQIFMETPCVKWILANQSLWDFFYEHCSYFTAESITTAMEIAGFKVENVRHIFGGQYLWVEAKISNEKPIISKSPTFNRQLVKQFGSRKKEIINTLQNKLKKLASKGKIAIWGAGAKGVTFANLFDPDRKLIQCVIDLNPKKHGHYLPGTGHPIVSYPELRRYGINTAILMNPNYYEENIFLLREADLNIDLINLTE